MGAGFPVKQKAHRMGMDIPLLAVQSCGPA